MSTIGIAWGVLVFQVKGNFIYLIVMYYLEFLFDTLDFKLTKQAKTPH